RPHREAIARAWEMCIAFDDLCARARYAIEVNGFAPAIGGGPLVIRNGRHPLLTSPPSEGSEVVPFDLALAPDEFTVLVSGPNTGGKTVLIKAVGLLCLMAQSGIIPPIGPHSTLPAFTTWFADIGDRQSIAQSLSTFSAHVAVLRDILRRAGRRARGGGARAPRHRAGARRAARGGGAARPRSREPRPIPRGSRAAARRGAWGAGSRGAAPDRWGAGRRGAGAGARARSAGPGPRLSARGAQDRGAGARAGARGGRRSHGERSPPAPGKGNRGNGGGRSP